MFTFTDRVAGDGGDELSPMTVAPGHDPAMADDSDLSFNPIFRFRGTTVSRLNFCFCS